MPVSKTSAAAAVLALFSAVPLLAQAEKPAAKTTTTTATVTTTTNPSEMDGGAPTYLKPETPEERMKRLGTTEDPGPDPDPKKIWTRFGKRYHIEKFTRQWEAYNRVPEGWVRPMAQVNIGFELYQRNAKYIWYWAQEPGAAGEDTTAREKVKYTPAQLEAVKKFSGEFSEVTPPQSTKTIHFEEASQGLPDSGSWRNALAVADMNNDGCPDIIAPPQRGVGGGAPVIFLGDCKGHWKVWSDVKYPRPIDYGSVVAADFNHDGNMDLAFSIHLTGVVCWLGDGKGGFREDDEGLPVDRFPSRKLLAVDVNADGWTDIVAISEGASAQGVIGGPRVRAFVNQKKGTAWKEVEVVPAEASFAGDSLTSGNFNGDKYPDFAGGSIFFQSAQLLWASSGLLKWKELKAGDAIVPVMSSHTAAAAGHFSSKKLDDVVFAYYREFPDLDASQVTAPKLKNVTGVDLVSFEGKEPKRKTILRVGGGRAVLGLGSADMDGDGNPDIIYAGWSPKREFVLLLGDGKGGFRQAKLEGIKAEPQTNYDLTIADVNNDGRPDVVIAYESDKQGALGFQNGSIHVFLNEGVK